MAPDHSDRSSVLNARNCRPLRVQAKSGIVRNMETLAETPRPDGIEAGRTVVAMSGGVDSSVVAALLAEAGHDVVGVTLQLYDHGAAVGRKGACCAGQDIHDARNVADHLGIPHYVLDYETRFRESVIDDFADSYLRGETPVPCIRCNQTVKFSDLMDMARKLGAAALATGHYARRVDGPGGAELWRAADETKDQSYFLFATTDAQLDLLRFPLGEQCKEETRNLAQRFSLPVADKPDSQDICFVPNGSYASVIEKLRPEATEPGVVVHLDGQRIGSHRGIHAFTIGQRRGIDAGGHTEPLYVVNLDAARREVTVGPKEALAVSRITLGETNWIGWKAGESSGERSCQVRFRSAMRPIEATLQMAEDRAKTKIVFSEPQYGVAPGQACVVYDSDRVLGGGWITSRETVWDATGDAARDGARDGAGMDSGAAELETGA